MDPAYIDNIQLIGGAPVVPYKSSWENSLDAWTPIDSSGITPTNVAGGAPAGAITDGDYALKVEVGNETAWTIQTHLDMVNVAPNAFQAMKENNTVEFDLFVEAGEILPDNFTTIGVRLNHPLANGNTESPASYSTLDFNDTGTTFHVSWNYGNDPMYNPDASWAQFQFLTVADDTANGADPISEFYVDNFRFSTVTALPGDFDEDGDVDGADFLTWQRDTNVGNLADWQANYGPGAAAAVTTAVPEPTSALLCMIGSSLVLSRRKR